MKIKAKLMFKKNKVWFGFVVYTFLPSSSKRGFGEYLREYVGLYKYKFQWNQIFFHSININFTLIFM